MQDPPLQAGLVVRAVFGIHLLGNRPHYVHGVPADTDGPRTGTGTPVVLAFELHVADQGALVLHHGVPAQDRFAGEQRCGRVHFLQLRVTGRVIASGMAFHGAPGGRVGGNVFDQFTELVDIGPQGTQGGQVFLSGFYGHDDGTPFQRIG